MKQLFIFAAALGVTVALGAAPKASPVGSVVTLSGKISLYSASAAEKAKDLRLGQMLYAGDRVKTAANGRVSLALVDGTQLKVNYSTDITLRGTDSRGKASERGIGSIKIALGDLWAKVTKKNSRLEFDTPAAVAAVKGTEPSFNVSDEDTCIKLKEGRLDLQSGDNSLSMGELTQLCMQNKGQKLDKSLVQSWDGKGGFDKTFDDASTVKVEIEFGNQDDGTAGKAVLEYGK